MKVVLSACLRLLIFLHFWMYLMLGLMGDLPVLPHLFIELLLYINNLRYADETTLMAESEEELKSLLIKVKEEIKKLA